MKKLTSILLVMLLPLLGFAQDAKKEAAPAAPKKATISTYRIFVKAGHGDAFKAAIAAHAQKFHTGNWKWRVYDVLSGPEGDSYQIVEGPNSWTDLEGRGDLGAEHSKDYDANITPHVEKTTPESYFTYLPDVSTVAATAYAQTKTLITRVYVKPGRTGQVINSLKTWKKVWEKQGVNVGVWRSFYSGEPCFLIVGRLKNGFKDLDDDTMSQRKAADEIGGAGAYDRMMEDAERNTERTVGEIIEFKPELSSK